MQNKLCVILVLDEEARTRLNNYLKHLENYDINADPVHGHITLASYLSDNITELVHYTRAFFLNVNQFHLKCTRIKRLTKVNVSCFPNESQILRSLYETFHQKYDSLCDEYTKLSTGQWTPHITMYNQSSGQSDFVEQVLKEAFVPFEANIVRVELSIVHDEGIETVFAYDLGTTINN